MRKNELSEQLNKLLDMTCSHIKDGINKIAEEDVIGKATETIKNINLEEIINNEPEVKTFLNVVNLFMNKPLYNKTTTEKLLEIRAHLASQENNDIFIENHIKIIEDILECKTIDTTTIDETIILTEHMIDTNNKEIKELNSKIKRLKEKNKMYKSLNKIYEEIINE
jgi:septal ring factor EnvC (AmiA/AmiB activator)